MPDLKKIAGQVNRAVREEGIFALPGRTLGHLARKRERELWEKHILDTYSDVLFISGCNEQLPHPHRYRVLHQMEQLLSRGISSETVYYTRVSRDLVRCFSVFVIFRCPLTTDLEDFVREAHRLHKKVFYDVDDLVIDTCYTDQIPYLNTMSKTDREAYDENVRNMGRMLSLCDGAITTTQALAKELEKYVPKVLINRNCASEEMLNLSETAYLNRKKQERTIDSGTEGKEEVILGYFSGSATHLDDLLMIQPALISVLRKYPQVKLQITGILEVPEAFREFGDRIMTTGFLDYRKLPEKLSAVSVNLAPLTASIFNEAKSENKWVEAALVRVPSICSDLGAFREMISPDVDGILAEDPEDWEKKLELLILSPKLRSRIGEAAYQTCRAHCITINNAQNLTSFLERERGKNCIFCFPAVSVSGGLRVAQRHARMLYEEGLSISVAVLEGGERWMEADGIGQIPVLPARPEYFRGTFDLAVATMWNTWTFPENTKTIRRRFYLVQNYEPDFYEPQSPNRLMASATYRPDSGKTVLSVSKWCTNWLKEQYQTDSFYIPNGIDFAAFPKPVRSFEGKIRILIEGDSEAAHKNVDESFRIVEKLPRDCYEVWYMSYAGSSKPWYRVDRFFHKVPYEKVGKIYAKCDILLKTSLLESFSYPPLEMMATGGFAVVLVNDGNKEYLKDGENCLCYMHPGDLDAAADCIRRLSEDAKLREKIREGGLRTAASRDWSKIKPIVLESYLEK